MWNGIGPLLSTITPDLVKNGIDYLKKRFSKKEKLPSISDTSTPAYIFEVTKKTTETKETKETTETKKVTIYKDKNNNALLKQVTRLLHSDKKKIS